VAAARAGKAARLTEDEGAAEAERSPGGGAKETAAVAVMVAPVEHAAPQRGVASAGGTARTGVARG
jgi:hypothetical protein